MVIVVIPVLEILGEALIAAGEAIAANAVPAAIGTGTAGVIIVASQHASSNSTPGANTTTVTGKGQLNCGDDGKYGDLLKKTAGGTLNRDHVPSKAALKAVAQDILDKSPALAKKLTDAMKKELFGSGSDPGLIAEEGETIAIPTRDHQKFSETYGGRNKADRIDEDAEDLQKASKRDTKAIEDAEGKAMDDECLQKYKKAAERINKKTHAEYVKELKDLINKVINKG